MSDVENIWNRSSIILKLMSRSTFWISHIHLSRFCRRSQCRFWQKYAQSRSKKIKFDFPLKFVMIIQNFSLLTPMKKITRLLFRILTSFCIISWIYFFQHYFTKKIEKNQSITWEKQKQKSNIFSLSWSIPQFTITPQNAYDIVIKTGENLLYRNEIYGFQILLDKKRAPPVRIQSEENPIHGKMVTLYMQYKGKYDFPLSIYKVTSRLQSVAWWSKRRSYLRCGISKTRQTLRKQKTSLLILWNYLRSRYSFAILSRNEKTMRT